MICYNYQLFERVLVEGLFIEKKDLIEVDAIVKMVKNQLSISIVPSIGLWKERVEVILLYSYLHFFVKLLLFAISSEKSVS